MVVVFHCIVTCYGMDAQNAVMHSVFRPVFAVVVPMFFAVSGFLVAGSLDHCKSVVSFLGLRVLRIIPALAGVTLFTALIVGPLVTSMPMGEYFSDPLFYRYLTTSVGQIQYALPGVFVDNPLSASVNAQLWTLPYEFDCYLILGVLALVAVFRKRAALLWFMVALYGYQLFKVLKEIYAPSSEITPMGVQGRTLIMIFMAGVFVYRFRDRIPYNGCWFFAALAATVLLVLIPPHGYRFVALPIVYVTVYLGMQHPRRHRWLLSGDYSYGIFLYGFTVQQTISSFGVAWQHWFINLVVALPVTLMLAVGSWWFIEKPALGMRRSLQRMDERYAVLFAKLRLANP
jgi:peptidoglycan/LPS O-acetylase OafA/YrhL